MHNRESCAALELRHVGIRYRLTPEIKAALEREDWPLVNRLLSKHPDFAAIQRALPLNAAQGAGTPVQHEANESTSTGVTLRTREHYELVMGNDGDIDPDLDGLSDYEIDQRWRAENPEPVDPMAMVTLRETLERTR